MCRVVDIFLELTLLPGPAPGCAHGVPEIVVIYPDPIRDGEFVTLDIPAGMNLSAYVLIEGEADYFSGTDALVLDAADAGKGPTNPGDDIRPVRSHYERHFFTTYWGVHENIDSELVAYMRCLTADSGSEGGSDLMSYYLNVYYEDFEDLCRERVVKLGYEIQL